MTNNYSLLNGFKMRLRRLAKASLAYAAYRSGLLDQLSMRRTGIKGQPRIIILGYHRVVRDFSSSSSLAIPSLLISADTFRRHLNLICHRFDCISLDESLEAISGRRVLKRDAVALTFDDGYQDFYDVAYPILRDYSLPAAIFVPTALIGQPAPLAHDQIYYLILEMARRNRSVADLLKKLNLTVTLPSVRSAIDGHNTDHYNTMRALFDFPQEKMKLLINAMKSELKFSDSDFPAEYRLLTGPMLSEMAAAGITIGAHTRNHVLLTQESADKAESEIRGSKVELEQKFGIQAHHFAYPDGRYNSQIADMVMKAGFKSACTVEDRPNTLSENPYQLKRKLLWERACLGIFSNFSEIVAECQLLGLFSNPIYKLQSSQATSCE